MQYNALKGFLSVPLSEANFFVKKKDFGVTAAIKQQWRLCRILGRADLVVTGGCGDGVTMLTM